jgi:hypothetical protein
MRMRQENKINLIEAGELVLTACESRIFYPGVDEQNLARSRFDFEGGVPVPS